MLTLIERKSRFTVLGKVTRRTAPAVRKRLCQLLLPIQDKVHTLTSDHGKEFADHETIAQTLQFKFYFTHPYAAWERGTNENTNGLLRQYFPKKSDFQTISNKKMEYAMSRLNFRPHKSSASKHLLKCSIIHLLHLRVELTCIKYGNAQDEKTR